jgi:hypothetical protein
MSDRQLHIINFKNRLWILLITLPITLGLFLFDFVYYFSLRSGENSFGLFLMFLVFYIQMYVVTIILSRFRYIPNGRLKFDQHGIYSERSSQSFRYRWSDITDLKFYYRGDRFWKVRLGRLTFSKGNRRYYNLHWSLRKDLDERFVDRIDINGHVVHVKIRNEKEKNLFFRLVSLSEKKGCHVEIMSTDFTTKLFGRTLEI